MVSCHPWSDHYLSSSLCVCRLISVIQAAHFVQWMGLEKEVRDQETDSVRPKRVDHSPISGNNILVEFMQCVLTCQRNRWISTLTQAKCVLDKAMNQEAHSHTPRCINKEDLLNSRWIRRSSLSYKVTFSSNERALQTNGGGGERGISMLPANHEEVSEEYAKQHGGTITWAQTRHYTNTYTEAMPAPGSDMQVIKRHVQLTAWMCVTTTMKL